MPDIELETHNAPLEDESAEGVAKSDTLLGSAVMAVVRLVFMP